MSPRISENFENETRKKKRNSTLLKTIKRDNAFNLANDHSSKRITQICQRSFNSARFPAYRCTLDACMHARNGCNKVFSDTCNDRTHSHSLPFAKYFGWLSRLCSLFHPFVCVMGTTIGQRDENHDPGKGKW